MPSTLRPRWELHEAVLAHVTDNPGRTPAMIAERLNEEPQRVYVALKSLCRFGRMKAHRMMPTHPVCYYAIGAPLPRSGEETTR